MQWVGVDVERGWTEVALAPLRAAANTSGIHIPPYIIRYPRRLKVSGSGGRPTARRCGCAVRVVTRSRVDGVRASCTHTRQGTSVPCTSPVKTGNCSESSSWWKGTVDPQYVGRTDESVNLTDVGLTDVPKPPSAIQ